MPMRASGKALGASVGRMIFAGQSSKRIEHTLKKVGTEKIGQALAKRGVSGVEVKDIAKAMTGESRGRAGWSQGKIKNVVAALQDVGVAHAEKSASHMVLQAAKSITPPKLEPRLSEAQLKAKFKREAVERRAEANAEEAAAANEPMGVLDRMRGAQGRANAVSRGTPSSNLQEQEQGKSIRETREQMRKDMQLQPKIQVPKLKR